jgi:hypothetical protein
MVGHIYTSIGYYIMEDSFGRKYILSDRSRIGFKIKKESKNFEVSFPSARNLDPLPRTVEKANEDIYATQQRYKQERQELKLALNSPARELPSISRYKSNTKIETSPISIKNSVGPLISYRSPTIKQSKGSYKRLEFIEKIMHSCASLEKSTKNTVKIIPAIEKHRENAYQKVNDIVTAIESMGPTSDLKEYLIIQNNLKKSENFLLDNESLGPTISSRQESQMYFESKLKKKNIWRSRLV